MNADDHSASWRDPEHDWPTISTSSDCAQQVCHHVRVIGKRPEETSVHLILDRHAGSVSQVDTSGDPSLIFRTYHDWQGFQPVS